MATRTKLTKQDQKYKAVRVRATLTGNAPILMNPKTEEVRQVLRNKANRKPRSFDIDPHKEAAKKIYRDSQGRICLPRRNLFACLRAAGRQVPWKTQRDKISTITGTFLPGLMKITSPWFIPLQFNGADPEQVWDLDTQDGWNKNGNRRDAVVIDRPCFKEWQLQVEFLIFLDETNEATIRRLFDVAGRFIGLCDFRPTTNGEFGTFNVTGWEVLEYISKSEETTVVQVTQA